MEFLSSENLKLKFLSETLKISRIRGVSLWAILNSGSSFENFGSVGDAFPNCIILKLICFFPSFIYFFINVNFSIELLF